MRAVLATACAVSIAGVLGCSIVLDTDTNPHRCAIDTECASLPDAVCDTVRHTCVPRLPVVIPDAGAAETGGGDGGGTLMCEQSFDNGTRLPAAPDGGLLPLPEAVP